jgi:hypothetical protein
MKKRKHAPWVLLIVLAAIFAGAAVAGAQSGGGYSLVWNTIDGGGAMFSTGGGYSLGGTIGQPDAGLLTGGGYTLGGGFWSGPPTYENYLPAILKS